MELARWNTFRELEADFKNGVLNVHLPKSATATPKAIDVKVS